MSHEHHEAEQNEIGGPVLLGIIVLVAIVITIALLSGAF